MYLCVEILTTATAARWKSRHNDDMDRFSVAIEMQILTLSGNAYSENQTFLSAFSIFNYLKWIAEYQNQIQPSFAHF